jgi:hypothetical protein
MPKNWTEFSLGLMTRLIVSALILTAAAQPVMPEEQPPEDVFNHSSRDLVFHVPPEFELVTQKRGYVNVAGQKVPRFQRIWEHGSDGIIVNVGVWPEAVWRLGTDKERFDLVLTGMQLAEPTLKVVSRHSYQLDGCQAESMTCFFAGPGGTSQRVDCFLAQPNVFMLGYASSKQSSWDDPTSKAFFQSISLKPKK